MNTQITAMQYKKRKAAERLHAYYAKKNAYYATLPAEERVNPDQFSRVWAQFKQHVKEAYNPKP